MNPELDELAEDANPIKPFDVIEKQLFEQGNKEFGWTL